MDATTILGLIAGAIGIVVFLGSVTVYLRGSRDKGTIATLESSNRALTERVSILEATERRLTEGLRAAGQRLTALETENAELRAQRTDSVVITEMSAMVSEILRAVQQQSDTISRLLKDKA